MVSKLNSERKAGESALQAISRIYGNIGIRGLFNGLGVRIIMIGTLTGAQWLIYDTFKVLLGVSYPESFHEVQLDLIIPASHNWRTLGSWLRPRELVVVDLELGC
jgi:hypothetical protein